MKTVIVMSIHFLFAMNIFICICIFVFLPFLFLYYVTYNVLALYHVFKYYSFYIIVFKLWDIKKKNKHHFTSSSGAEVRAFLIVCRIIVSC